MFRKIEFLIFAGIGFAVGSMAGRGPYDKVRSKISSSLSNTRAVTAPKHNASDPEDADKNTIQESFDHLNYQPTAAYKYRQMAR